VTIRIASAGRSLVAGLLAMASPGSLLAAGPVSEAMPTFSVLYDVGLVASERSAHVTIRLWADSEPIEWIRFRLDPGRYRAIEADGELVAIDGGVEWHPPRGGGKFRYVFSINHLRDDRTYDARCAKNWAIFRGDDLVPRMRIRTLPIARSESRMRLRLPEVERSGRVVLELDNVDKSYGKTRVFERADLLVERGERLALVGPNGVGKSTLMRLLAGVEETDGGKRTLGHNVKTGYFSQERYDLDASRTVLENMSDGAPIEMIPRLRSLLGAFLFHGDDVDKKVKVLSGGEKSRLALARLLLQPANVLLLDEPTNHLDIDSKEILLDAIRAYQGTLVFVSHDRYFLDELSTKVAEVKDGGVHVHWGGYNDFLRAQEAAAEKPSPVEPVKDVKNVENVETPEASSPPAPDLLQGNSKSVSKNRARAIQERLEEIELTIQETEIGIDSLEGRMSVPGFYDDAAASTQVVETHEALKVKLKALYEEWEQLAQKAAAFC